MLTHPRWLRLPAQEVAQAVWKWSEHGARQQVLTDARLQPEVQHQTGALAVQVARQREHQTTHAMPGHKLPVVLAAWGPGPGLQVRQQLIVAAERGVRGSPVQCLVVSGLG